MLIIRSVGRYLLRSCVCFVLKFSCKIINNYLYSFICSLRAYGAQIKDYQTSKYKTENINNNNELQNNYMKTLINGNFVQWSVKVVCDDDDDDDQMPILYIKYILFICDSLCWLSIAVPLNRVCFGRKILILISHHLFLW